MIRELDFVDEYYAGKDLSLLKKLTLVIPTYNRNYYLSRCLWYHAHFPFGEIIVADSSPEEKKVVNRETVQKVREMFGANIRYLEYEPETEKYGGDIYRKWGDAVQHVETEYSQICTDKEFLIPTTLNKCLLFLEENKEYSIAKGINYNISKEMNKIRIHPWQISLKIQIDDSFSRLLSYALFAGSGTMFGIQRSNLQKTVYSNLSRYNLSDIRFGETLLELQPIIMGKLMCFTDMAFNCRDIINFERGSYESKKSESSFLRYPLFINYPENILNDGYAHMKQCLLDQLIISSKEGRGNMKETLDYILPKLMEMRYGASKTFVKSTKILDEHKLIRKIWGIIPERCKYLVRECAAGKTSKKENIMSLSNEIEIISTILMMSDKTSHHINDSIFIMSGQ